jgi:uncharacterized protein YegP (UPF0339 family)
MSAVTRKAREWGPWRLDRVEVYQADDGWRWRWRAAGNGQVMATGAEAYDSAGDCEAGARRVCGRWVAYLIDQ